MERLGTLILNRLKKAYCKSRPFATSKRYQRANYILKCYVCYNNVKVIIRSTFDWVSLFPALTHTSDGCIRQNITLQNLANHLTFFLSLESNIERIFQVKEHFLPRSHLWNSVRSRDSLRLYLRSQKLCSAIFRLENANRQSIQV